MDIRMKQIYMKILAAFFTLVIVVTMVVSVSYAWVTLSKSPSVSGAQVAISGGTTILLAPDVTETVEVDGEEVTLHYPGSFSDNLVFSRYDSYDYLGEICGITPVSTADGISWLMPAYDRSTGELRGENDFTIDNTLEYANVTDSQKGGKYVYLDFWVVSPGSEYELRVSMDRKSGGGSSLLELPSAVNDDSTISGFALSGTTGDIASIARVGFLVNTDTARSRDMLAYSRSGDYDSRYKKMLGVYQNAGDNSILLNESKFTIYEPNGLLHVAPGLDQGDYAITEPLAYDRYMRRVSKADISDRLTVQTQNVWSPVDGERKIDQIFQAGVSGVSGLTAENATSRFYNDYLQWNITSLITAGEFFTSTEALYANATDGVVPASRIAANVDISGATDDVVITELERNVPQRIRMFIWLEGQDIDCVSTSSAVTDFALNLELAGASK